MDWYGIIKSIHIIAVISWLAGLLYLPRIFVYHCSSIDKDDINRIFKIMERRLYYFIMTPALYLVWASGIYIVYIGGFWEQNWLIAKVSIVVLLTLFHGFLGFLIEAFASDSNAHSQKFFRIVNEVPTVLLIFVVFLVVLKPGS